MAIGYIRGSKHEQDFDLQVDSLKKAGCEKVFSEKISGAFNSAANLPNSILFSVNLNRLLTDQIFMACAPNF